MSDETNVSPKPSTTVSIEEHHWQESDKQCPKCNMLVWVCPQCWHDDICSIEAFYQCGNCDGYLLKLDKPHPHGIMYI